MFDYIIVGGGSAGCVVAARLSEDPDVTVCLLEAGGDGDRAVIRTPIGTIAMLPRKLHNWAFNTVPQKGMNDRVGYQPRGKALGGSSAINGMVYTRGHPHDYDEWASLGNPGWSFEEVLPYFRKAENNEVFDDEFHGQGGPLNVASSATGNPFQQRFVTAGLQAGLPYTADFNGAQQEGVGMFQVTQKNGERWSAARGYLFPNLGRPNLTVITSATTTRVLFENKRAVGVEYLCDGVTQEVRARREVILSGGAFGSPQLLMLSGVGDSKALEKHGIAVVHHLPGVGRNLQEHIGYVLAYRSTSRDLFGLSLRGVGKLAREFFRYRKQRRGMVASNFAEVGAFVRTRPEEALPDIRMVFMNAMATNHGRDFHWGHGFSCSVVVLRPKSRGQVLLASSDPLDDPLIDPNYFSHPDDLEVLVRGFKRARGIMSTAALVPWRGEELYSGQARSDEEIRAIVRQRADSAYHPVGTCQMGQGAEAVVDARLRVHGLTGLRVVDASIMPTLPSTNTNAPSIMIGEKAADMIREDFPMSELPAIKECT